MLGSRFHKRLIPTEKYRKLTYTIGKVNNHWVVKFPRVVVKNSKLGKPSITLMETYIKGINKLKEMINRRFIRLREIFCCLRNCSG